MCPSKIHTLELSLQCDGVRGGARGRCIGHEGGAPMNGISALVNATHGICEPESGLSPDTESADTLPLDFPASRAVRNIFLLFIKK